MKNPTDTRPAIHSRWESARETREVLAVLPGASGNGRGYFVRCRIYKGWPRRCVGEAMFSGSQWNKFVVSLKREGEKRVEAKK